VSARALVKADDCARCDDDSRVSRSLGRRPSNPQRAVRCAVCGQPASFAYNGEAYCAKHYLEVAARARV